MSSCPSVPDNQKLIPIAIVGLHFGRQLLESEFRDPGTAKPWFQLAAVCSMDRPLTEQVAMSFGVRAVHDLDELLRDPAIPVIGLFTGPVGRAALLRRCIRAGKHVMTTKPLEVDADAALDVLREAKKLGLSIHQNSPNPTPPPDLAVIQQWQREHDLGALLACRTETWTRYHEKADGSWYDDPQQCPAAPLFRLGIYLINDLSSFFGKARSVQLAHSRLFTGRPTADHAQLTIAYDNGAIASIFASFCIDDGQHYSNAFVMNFERGTVYRNSGPRPEGWILAPRQQKLEMVRRVDDQHIRVLRAEVPSGSGWYQWEALAKAIRGQDIGPVLTPEQTVSGLRVMDAIRRAQNSGQTEPVHDGS
ncbi:MAG: Gfo/Idh/MocA family oxidoreductase [Phycisphaeraceae bacterium]|nr:Gfo/Idh/MocA family oxidoreductase [Phycisphaeraceae bacterium]